MYRMQLIYIVGNEWMRRHILIASSTRAWTPALFRKTVLARLVFDMCVRSTVQYILECRPRM